jgi:hypothetical protein
LAVALSFVALVVQFGYIEYLDGDDPYWTPINAALFVLILGLVPAAVFGGVGAAVVHLVTRLFSSQWPAVLLAGLMGLIVGLVVFSDDLRLMGLLAIDAAGGRLALVPLVRRRRAASS